MQQAVAEAGSLLLIPRPSDGCLTNTAVTFCYKLDRWQPIERLHQVHWESPFISSLLLY